MSAFAPRKHAFPLPRRGLTRKPRATPWVLAAEETVALKGRNNMAKPPVPAATVAPLQGWWMAFGSSTQGVALG